MKLKVSYHLTNNEVVSHETSDFASLAEARDRCAKMINTPGSTACLNGPDICHVINMANVACVEIVPAR